MNHYHDAAIAEEIRKVEKACYQRAVCVAIKRRNRLKTLSMPNFKGGFDGYADRIEWQLDWQEAHPAPRLVDGDYRAFYHAINNECERLVG